MTTLNLMYEFYFTANPNYYNYLHTFHLEPDTNIINKYCSMGNITMIDGADKIIKFEARGKYILYSLSKGYKLLITDLYSFNPYDSMAEKIKLNDIDVTFEIQTGIFCLLENKSEDNHLDVCYTIANKRFVFNKDPLGLNTDISERIYYTSISHKTIKDLIIEGIEFETKGWYSFIYNINKISSKSKIQLIDDCNTLLKINKLEKDTRKVATVWDHLTDRSPEADEIFDEFIKNNNFDKIDICDKLIEDLSQKNILINNSINYEPRVYTVYSTKGKLLMFIITENCTFIHNRDTYKFVWINKISYITKIKPLLSNILKDFIKDLTYLKDNNLAIILQSTDTEIVNELKSITKWQFNQDMLYEFRDKIKNIYGYIIEQDNIILLNKTLIN